MSTWNKYSEYYKKHKFEIAIRRRRRRSIEKIKQIKEYFKKLAA